MPDDRKLHGDVADKIDEVLEHIRLGFGFDKSADSRIQSLTSKVDQLREDLSEIKRKLEGEGGRLSVTERITLAEKCIDVLGSGLKLESERVQATERWLMSMLVSGIVSLVAVIGSLIGLFLRTKG